MLAFAANSLLCRAALRGGRIDPATFTSVRIAAGAAVLWLVVRLRGGAARAPVAAGNWPSALALFVYAAAFSFSYVSLTAATGALLLFGAVQASALGYAVWFSALPSLATASAATVQLSVPVIAAAGGVALLGEPPTPRLVAAGLAILGGIALVVARRGRSP